MPDGFTVHPLDLHAHAEALDRQRDRIGGARSAADSSGLGAESFGLICQFFAVHARGHAETAKHTLDALRDATGQLAGGVRDTAGLYQRVDQTNSTLFEGGR